jgi:FkbM family methyltransferase
LAYLLGRREPDEMRALQSLLKPGSVAYDLGANYGMHTLLMARLVGPQGVVVAFEPEPAVFASLSGNIALNRFENVRAVPLAVSDSSGEAFFEVTSSTATGRLSDSSAGHSVQTTTLDEYVLDKGNPVPDFIKIDVEGAESRAMQGAMRVLRQFRPSLLIELHTPEQDVGVGEILLALGYRVTRVSDGTLVENLTSGWPDPRGMFGTVVAQVSK